MRSPRSRSGVSRVGAGLDSLGYAIVSIVGFPGFQHCKNHKRAAIPRLISLMDNLRFDR
jgi:hypothetical protein